ncbi:MAG: GNAT family N-acetyltransferase [Butyricicoccus sp.]|nr:GNAT family N-acetyltransferase [Butyricicoccus pullicaecorum]MCI6719942.1 GNAT family N-acetyltransferase [Clostridiales bacterium]MDY5972271.1 GNAT family N-acetyltransferase [Butyricicoccus sp.]
MQIIIRNWKLEDAAGLAAQANDPGVSDKLRNTFPYPYTEEDAAFFINIARRTHCDRGWHRCIEVDGRVAGGVSLRFGDDVLCCCGELGCWLGRDYWNRGIATEAVRIVCERAFQETELVRIEAEVFSNNPGAIRVLEKNCFQREGYFCNRICKHDRLYDSILFATFK